MRLYEYQAKKLFKDCGITVPNGRVVTSIDELDQATHELKPPLALKAQVLAGGRGLAGGVQFANDLKEVVKVGSEIFNKPIGVDRPPAILIEEKLESIQELYAAVTWDYKRKCAVLIGSSRGGADIETISKTHPEDVAIQTVNAFAGFAPYQARTIAGLIKLKDETFNQYSAAMMSLCKIFQQCDAEIVEVNPFALQKSGLVALDAKIILDDRSNFRQSILFNQVTKSAPRIVSGIEYRRTLARQQGIPTYIELPQGNTAIIADGAGSGMLTLDLLTDRGGLARAYCEMGGEITSDLIEKTMQMAIAVDGVRVLLINLIGGLNRMDEMAVGIARYMSKNTKKIPTIVRMSGTRQEEGRTILAENGIPFFDDLDQAITEAVKLGGRN